jgi:hypothetical protein
MERALCNSWALVDLPSHVDILVNWLRATASIRILTCWRSRSVCGVAFLGFGSRGALGTAGIRESWESARFPLKLVQAQPPGPTILRSAPRVLPQTEAFASQSSSQKSTGTPRRRSGIQSHEKAMKRVASKTSHKGQFARLPEQ